MKTRNAVILLGANLGNPQQQIARALESLEVNGCKVVATSSLYLSYPWGDTNQPDFLNQVAVIQTSLTALDLLRLLQSVEREAGPAKTSRWGARYLDIDILDYDGQVLATPDLELPHPQITFRRFTLVPLNEVLPDWRHPLLGLTAAEMLAQCPDTLEVKPFPGHAA
jgi:2-amino-4-hydroxy-6-hydroxymethyldihydropteridine diphosphokinase